MRLDLENQGGCSTIETDLENLHGSLVSVWAPRQFPPGNNLGRLCFGFAGPHNCIPKSIATLTALEPSYTTCESQHHQLVLGQGILIHKPPLPR